MRGVAAGDGALLHGFQQRRLRFRRGAVDLVGQNEVGEDGAGLKAKRLGAAVVTLNDHAADDVGGHQVRRELDAGILEMQNAAERSEQRRLAEPRDAFQQNVAASQETDEHAIHHRLLANNDLSDFVAYLIEVAGSDLEWGVGWHLFILTVRRAGRLDEVAGRPRRGRGLEKKATAASCHSDGASSGNPESSQVHPGPSP